MLNNYNGRTHVERAEKQNHLDLISETFFMSKKLFAFDFVFAPVIELPLKPKHLERDIVSDNCYLSKRGQFEQNHLLSCFDLSDFKKSLEEQINTSCSVLEESIVQTYEKHSKNIQDKLQELFAVLERISMPLILNTLLMKGYIPTAC